MHTTKIKYTNKQTSKIFTYIEKKNSTTTKNCYTREMKTLRSSYVCGKSFVMMSTILLLFILGESLVLQKSIHKEWFCDDNFRCAIKVFIWVITGQASAVSVLNNMICLNEVLRPDKCDVMCQEKGFNRGIYVNEGLSVVKCCCDKSSTPSIFSELVIPPDHKRYAPSIISEPVIPPDHKRYAPSILSEPVIPPDHTRFAPSILSEPVIPPDHKRYVPLILSEHVIPPDHKRFAPSILSEPVIPPDHKRYAPSILSEPVIPPDHKRYDPSILSEPVIPPDHKRPIF